MSEHRQDFPDPNYDSPSMHEVSHPRRNGCSCPWHPFQLIAWFFILLFTVAHFGFLAFYVPGLWRIAIYAIPGLVLLVHATANIVTTAIDPAEPAVKRKLRSGRRLRPVFNRSVHKHVIEDRHCNLCQVDVSSSAKHCRLCDKCVMDFDHHCKWLNNCIGTKNYRWFIATISSALLGAVMLLVYNAALFILYFAGRDNLRYDCNFPSNSSACNETLRIFGTAMPDAVFPVLTAILGVLALIAVVLVGHLTVFHFYLISKGLSTYDYIVLHRENEEDTRNGGGLERGFHGRCAFLRRKLNRVTPQSIPMDGEQSIEGGDTGSIGSNNSAGMANFGRTPPLSVGSEESIRDNRTDEQKLEVQTSWAYVVKEAHSNDNCTVATVDVSNPTMKNSGSIAHKQKVVESDEGVSPPPLLDTETTKRLNTSDEQLPVPCYESLEVEEALLKEASAKDLQNGGTLAVGNTEERLFESTMDTLNAVARADHDTPAASNNGEEEVDWETVNKGSSQVMIQDSSNMATQSLEDRHTELKAQTEQQILSESRSISTSPIPLSPSRTSLDPSLPSIKSYSLLANENLATHPASDFTPCKHSSVETLQQSTHTNTGLQEIPLNMLQFSSKDLPEVAESPATNADCSVSPITKKVSFQDLEREFGAEADAMYSPRASRPLPSPPLPPIGSSRPLPPLGYGYRDVLGSHDSLLSGSSQLLSRSGSVSSLPLPDPRYRRGVLPRLSRSSNLSLDAYPSGGKAKRKGKRRKVSEDQLLPECREVRPPSPSPKD